MQAQTGDLMQRVAAAVIIEDGRLFLTRRAPGERLAGMWELPGGKVEPNETPAECLRRELLEELGMRTTVREALAATLYEYEHGCFSMVALRAERESGFELRVHDRFAWVLPNEVRGYALAPADVELVNDLRSSGVWR